MHQVEVLLIIFGFASLFNDLQKQQGSFQDFSVVLNQYLAEELLLSLP